MWLLDQWAERHIAEAQAKGEFDNLAGSGEPLILDDDSHVPPELRAGYRLLKNAGCLPPELEQRREAIQLLDILKGIRHDDVDLVQGSVIDIAISPQQATISALLSHVRKADIVGVSSLRRGVAEAIEAVAHGDESTSRVVGRVIDEIKLPPGTIIGAVVRGNDVMIANDNLRIEQGDHVIMFLTDKKFITDVERLFQPSPFFL